MSTRLQIKSILLVLIVTSTVLLITIVFYTQEQIKQVTTIITDDRIKVVNQASNRLELRFSDAIKILQFVSKNDHIVNPPSASAIDNKLNGIPENFDTERRKVMNDVFEIYGGFQNLLFLLPNGDVYINEPFLFQKNSTVSNFAFRDWYKDVISSHNVTVSQVITSKSSGKPNVVIALPVFSQSGDLEGILTGSLSLDKTQEYLKNLQIYAHERLLIVDNAQTVAADSEGILKGHKLFTLKTIIQNALVGKTGTSIDTINDTKTFIVYSPVKIGQTTWAIISMQPYDEAFYSINEVIQESWILTILIVIIASISSYYLYHIFERRVKLSKELEKVNIDLHIQSQKLRDMDIAKEEFITMITHELKTPLVTIDGYCEMLKESGVLGDLNKEQQDAIERIHANSGKLGLLISDMLDAQKIDLKKMKFTKKEFSADGFIEEIIDTFSPLMEEKKIEFVNSTKKSLTIKSDKHRLFQVYGNLIKNSVDFVPENAGKIEVGVKDNGGDVLFYIKDNGSGIPKEKQTQLFRKFYQIDTSLKRKHGGTGLGLVICKGIVEGLGGKIWLESEVDKGTTVWFTIPKDNSDMR
jgi:signal transduction histidine kinase